MKVLLCSFDSPATLRGGVEWYVHHLARRLGEEGVDVRVLARKPRGEVPSELLSEVAYEWVALPSPRGPVTHRYRLVFQPFYDRAVAARASWADVVHGQNVDGAGAAGRAPLVATVHTTEVDEWASSRLGGWREAVYQRRIHEVKLAQWRRMVGRARHLVTPARHVVESLVELGAEREKVEVFPNPVEPLPRFPQAEAKARLGLPEEPLVLYLGRLAPVKRVDRLLAAMRELPHARLVVAGDGPSAGALQQEAERLGLGERAAFLGRVDDARKALLLNAADAFCLPSEHEGQPLALLEAISVGVPVVATKEAWVPPSLAPYGLWGDDVATLLRQALAKGRHGGGPVPDYRDLARRMVRIYEQALSP